MKGILFLLWAMWGWLRDLGERGEVTAGQDPDKGAGDEGEGTEDDGEAAEAGPPEEGNEGSEADEGEGEEAGDEEDGDNEQTRQQVAAKKDPTEGMTDAQKAAYWQRQADIYKKDMFKFKGRQKAYQEKYGPLGEALRVQEEKQAKVPEEKPIDELTPEEFQQQTLEKATTAAEQRIVLKQRRERMIESEDRARERYTGENGTLNYDEIFDSHVKPFLDENPWAIQIMLASKDAGEAAMALAALLDPSLMQRMNTGIQRKAREDLVGNIQKATQKAVTIKGSKAGKHTTKKTAADFNAMSDDDLEAEAAAIISGQAD